MIPWIVPTACTPCRNCGIRRAPELSFPLDIVGIENRRIAAVIEEIPLAEDPYGVYRIGTTRMTFDLVARLQPRATADEIVQKFPSLELADVYQVIGHLLKYQTELDECFKGASMRKTPL